MRSERRCLAFDFDGVLVDSNAVKRAAYFSIFERVDGSRQAVDAALRALPAGDRFDVIAQALIELPEGQQRDLPSVASLADAYNQICERHQATCGVMRGVADLLPRLKEKYVLYVNSATPEDVLRRVVAARGWAGHFADVLGRPNDKAQNLALIIEREAIDPSQLVMIGDGQRDLDGARLKACKFVGVKSDGNDFAEPTELLADLTELEAALDRLWS